MEIKMRNAYYIDDTKKHMTLKVLGRIHGMRLHAKHIESILEEEIIENKNLIQQIKRKQDEDA
jgi:hypothetical protein